MQKFQKLPAAKRFWLGFSTTILILAGTAFAALVSQNASLTGNSIETANADLRIGTSATSFAASRTGFDFSGVVPGGTFSPTDGNSVYLKNYGTANLSVKLAISSTPTNTSNVDLNKVMLKLSRVDNGYTQTFSLKSLIDSASGGGTQLSDIINGGVTAQYKLSVSMASDAFTGSSAALSGIDFVFSGIGA